MPHRAPLRGRLERRRTALVALVITLLGTSCGTDQPSLEPDADEVPGGRLEAVPESGEDVCEGPADGVIRTLQGPLNSLYYAQWGDRLVSVEWGDADANGWVLWERSSGRAIARGPSHLRPDLAGETLLTAEPRRGFQLRSAVDGALRAEIRYPNLGFRGFGLTADGRHLYVFDRTWLRAWNEHGEQRVTYTTNELDASRIHAGADVLRIAPSGTARIDTLVLATGEVRPSASGYAGTFQRWLLDGRHFVTFESKGDRSYPNEGTFRVYTADVTLVQSLPWKDQPFSPGAFKSVGGDGEHVWLSAREASNPSAPPMVRVYQLGSPEPVLSFVGTPLSTEVRTAMEAFLLDGYMLRLLDLRGSTPITHDHAYGGGQPRVPTADGEGRWAFVDWNVLYDGTRVDARGLPRTLGCPPAQSLAGASDKVAIATGDRRVRIYVIRAGVPKLAATLTGVLARKLAFSADGRVLFVLGDKDGLPLGSGGTFEALELDADGRVLGSTALTELIKSPGTWWSLISFTVSASGARVAGSYCYLTQQPSGTCIHALFDQGKPLCVASAVPYVSGVLLSPSGEHMAVPDFGPGRNSLDRGVKSVPDMPPLIPTPRLDAAQWTNIYDEKTLIAQLHDVRPVSWVDDARLLIERAGESVRTIIDLTGKPVATVEKMVGNDAKPAGPGRFHDLANVYDAADGKRIWSLPSDSGQPATQPLQAVVVGDYFVYMQRTAVRFVKIAPQSP